MSQPPTDPADTVGDVIEALDSVTSRARTENSPLGYFAALYGQVTRTVAHGIDSSFFDDGPRMQRLMVVFANRYLAALHTYRKGGQPTRSWEVAFATAEDATPILLQHLLLGINAHINLDLGIAAAQVAPGDDISQLRRDFDRINQVLAMMTRQAQQAVAQISPWLGLLDVIGGRTDDQVVRFSIEVARHQAWTFAVELAHTAPDGHAGPIGARDRFVADLGRRVRRPGLLTPALLLIRLRESKDIPDNLDVLTSMSPPDLDTIETHMQADPPQ
jgi:hypothetical protein